MADFYTEMGKVAAELLAPTSQGGLGQGTVLLSRKEVVSVPEEPWLPPEEVTTEETLRAAVRGVSKELVGTEVGGTIILASDRQAICAVPDMGYIPGDRLVIDGAPVHIIAVEDIPGAGIRSAVKFFIRG